MILMSFFQEDKEIAVAVFDREEEGREFLQLVPGYECVEDQIEKITYTYETIDPQKLPEYIEISYKGNKIPLTKFMFSSREKIDVEWKKIPNLSEVEQGLVEGTTKVDAYVLPNLEVEAYIQKREEGYQRVANILHRLHYVASRDYAGSEDGEAILYQKKGEKEAYILSYLDPDFVEFSKKLKEEELEEWILSLIE